MGSALGEVVPYAVGVAISPVPIIAVILMLFSTRAGLNGPAFLVGWVAGLVVVTALVILVAGSSGADSTSNAGLVGWLKIALGALLVVLGFAQWRRRPQPGQQADTPKWMSSINDIAPGRAAGLGVLLSAVNPKNLTLAAGAGIAIAQGSLDAASSAVAVAVFAVIGSISIAVPLVYYLLGGESARRTLDGWRTWLGEHSAAVMTVLLVVIGAVLVGKGLSSVI